MTGGVSLDVLRRKIVSYPLTHVRKTARFKTTVTRRFPQGLKQGDAHPLKAIGVVASIIVFGSAMLVKEGWTLLGVLERS
jgi:hypothetical protein